LGTKDSQNRFLGAIIVACFGCLLIGTGVVYPIYFVSNGRSQYAWGGLRKYAQPIYGIVSSSSPEYHVELGSVWLRDVLVEVRNFYTNGSPVILIVSAINDQTITYDFHNDTNEPINTGIAFDYPSSLSLTVQYDSNTTLFSGWVLVQGTELPPLPPPSYPWFFSFFPSSIGLILLGAGLYLFWVQKQRHVSRNWNQALVFCTLGILLLSMSYPSAVRPHSYRFYHVPEYTDFGEFSGTVTAAEPRVNMTLSGLGQYDVELFGFCVETSSVTIQVFSLDGTLNHTLNNVYSYYPGVEYLVFDTTGDTVIEVVREAEDTAFRCWILTKYTPVEIIPHPSGAYAPFATLFLVSGIVLFVLGSYFVVRGFKDEESVKARV
jgi:hypothetical protein